MLRCLSLKGGSTENGANSFIIPPPSEVTRCLTHQKKMSSVDSLWADMQASESSQRELSSKRGKVGFVSEKTCGAHKDKTKKKTGKAKAEAKKDKEACSIM